MPNIVYRPREILLSDHQSLAFKKFWKASTNALACVTGFGGGKSVLLSVIAGYAAARYPGIYIMCGSPTYPMMKRTIWRTLNEIIPRGNVVHRNNQDMGMTLDFHNGTKPLSEIICLSASIPVQNWQGANIGLILLDECDGITEEHYIQAHARLRQVYIDQDGSSREMPNKLMVATNPPPGDHWLVRDFFEKKRNGYKLMQWSTLDNPYNPKSYRRLMLDTFHGEQRKRAIYGQLGVNFEGQIFDNFNPAYHIIDAAKAKKIRKQATFRLYGMDHGYVNPFAFIEISYWKKMEAWVITREYYMSRASIREKAKNVERIYPEFLEYPYPIYSDHSAQDRAELEREYDIITDKALKQRKSDRRKSQSTKDDSIQFVKEMMYRNKRTKHAQLFVSAECENTIREFKSFRNLKNKQDGAFQEYKYDGPNHAIDAIRYALYTHHDRFPSMFMGGGDREPADFGNNKIVVTDEMPDERGRYREEKEWVTTNDTSDYGV